MLRKTLTAALPALALIAATPAPLPASGSGTPDQIIVLPDSENDMNDMDVNVDVDLDAPVVNDSGDVVMHVGRRGGFLGLRLVEMTPELREHFGVSRDAGVLVGTVEKDSPAEKAGVKVGDIVTAADGMPVSSARDLSRDVRHRKAGDIIKIDLSRDRSAKQLSVTVSERPGHEVHVGDLGPLMRKKVKIYRDGDFDGPMLAPMPDMGRLQERLDEIEKRLKDLEKKLPAR